MKWDPESYQSMICTIVASKGRPVKLPILRPPPLYWAVGSQVSPGRRGASS